MSGSSSTIAPYVVHCKGRLDGRAGWARLTAVLIVDGFRAHLVGGVGIKACWQHDGEDRALSVGAASVVEASVVQTGHVFGKEKTYAHASL